MKDDYIVKASQKNGRIVSKKANIISRYRLYRTRIYGRIDRINNEIVDLNENIASNKEMIKKRKKNYEIYKQNLVKLKRYFLKESNSYFCKQLTSEKISKDEQRNLNNEYFGEVCCINEEIRKIKFKMEKIQQKNAKSREEIKSMKNQLKMFKKRLNILYKYLNALNNRINEQREQIKKSTFKLCEFYSNATSEKPSVIKKSK